jgi:hypothetical protein
MDANARCSSTPPSPTGNNNSSSDNILGSGISGPSSGSDHHNHH